MKLVKTWISVAVLVIVSSQASADVGCTLSDVQVDAYDHAGTYIHGNINRSSISFLSLCGQSNGVTDCSSKATDRRLAIALAAQAQGKSLALYFWSFTSC